MAHKSSPVEESQAVLGLLAEIPVQPQATLSRVVVNNPLVRVVYFAFDTGELLTDHSSPRAVVVHLITGAIRFTVGATEHAMVPGDVLYLAPGIAHSLIADAPSRLSLVMIDAPPNGGWPPEPVTEPAG